MTQKLKILKPEVLPLPQENLSNVALEKNITLHYHSWANGTQWVFGKPNPVLSAKNPVLACIPSD